MREIKFRAWDGKAMIYEMCMDVDLGSIDGQTFKVNFHTWPNYEFMQYTGRRDRRDREIYEGDIVIIPEHHSGDNLCREYRAVITYNAPEFQTEPYFDESWNDIEVIGNIHENPELFEGVK